MFCIFFFNDTATTEIYTLSLHDALPILPLVEMCRYEPDGTATVIAATGEHPFQPGTNWSLDGPSLDRKSTRLNSSHANISYAVFCLKKKKTEKTKIADAPGLVEVHR